MAEAAPEAKEMVALAVAAVAPEASVAAAVAEEAAVAAVAVGAVGCDGSIDCDWLSELPARAAAVRAARRLAARLQSSRPG